VQQTKNAVHSITCKGWFVTIAFKWTGLYGVNWK